MNARKLLTTVITLSIVTGQLSNVFADDFVPADVTTGTVTATAGLNSTGATIDLNASSNFTTNINTGTSTGAVTIGNSAAGAIGIASGSAFTIAGGATSTLSTTAGNLNLQPAGAGTGNVQVGTGAGTGTPDLLVLDNKNTAGDPAGSVGATYYNSNIGKFRCYEGAAWKDCDTTGGGGSTLQAAYNAGATITTAGAVPLAFTLTSGGFNVTGAGATAIGNNTGTVAVDSTSWDISAAGVASGLTGLTSSGTVNFTAGMSASGAAVNLNNNSNFATNVGTGTSTGAVSVGGGANTVAVNSSDWDISATGAMTGISGITNDAALTTTGGAVSLNASSNFAVNIGTGTTTSAVSIGGGANQVAINSSTWDISGAGAASGLTGLVSTGTVDFSGAGAFRTREVAGITNPGTACTTTGELIMDTNDNTLYVCTNAGTDAWSKVASGGDATTLDGIDSTQFLRSDTSDNFTSGTLTFDNGTTLTVNGVANLGDGGDAITVNTNTWDISGAGVASGFTGLTTGGIVSLGDNTGTVTINSSDWDISATGAMTGISGITNDAAFTTSGGAVSVNNNSNFATDINTGTSTGAVSIGGGSNTVTINSSTWDISGAGAASGFTTIDASGNITTSGGTFCIGTTCLNETTSATDSGAYVIGVFDEFDNSNSTTVQGVLNDLDAKIGSNAPNVEILTFYPEYPDTVVWRDGTTNAGTLTSNYDDANDEHFYRWTSNNATTQDIDLKFRFAIPADFASTGDFTYRFRTGTATEADNDVEMYFYNATDAMALCGSDTTNGTAGVWATGTITAATLNAGCAGLSAGDIIEIDVKLMDNSGGADYADVGYVSLAYNN
jgi:hypothetical protein